MRIAQITEYYYPHLGGITEHVHNLAKVFNAGGDHTIVVTSRMRPPAGAPDAHEYAKDAEFVRRLGTSRVVYTAESFARLTTGWALRRKLAALFREERIDLVHVHNGLAPTLGIVAPLAAWDVGLPVVATYHSWFRRSLLLRLCRRIAQYGIERHAANIAVSQPVIDSHGRYLDADWDLIPNGVDTTFFRPGDRAPEDALRDGPRLLFVGRFDPRNALGTAIRALPQVLERYPNATLTIAGDGPLRRRYEQLARPCADRVSFIGRVNGNRPQVYGASDLYLCPAVWASFGITLLEAMACGRPLLVSDIPGFRELVDGGPEAVLVRKNDVDAWARAILELIERPQQRAAMGAAGVAKAQTYAWPLIAERVMAVYRRAMG
jgi:phosphatidyl-myo-inositol alpha-mannosyltransferase